MKHLAAAAFAIVLVCVIAPTRAADDAAKMPPMPRPLKEHQWLQQLVGEWVCDIEMTHEPGKPPATAKGAETTRSLGGFWTVGDHKMDVLGQTMTGVLTLGYDVEKKTYVGTWVDSMQARMWRYEGTLDAAGKVLTLNTTGPRPGKPDRQCSFRETITVPDKDTKVFTSEIQQDDGTWVQFVKITSKRTK